MAGFLSKHFFGSLIFTILLLKHDILYPTTEIFPNPKSYCSGDAMDHWACHTAPTNIRDQIIFIIMTARPL